MVESGVLADGDRMPSVLCILHARRNLPGPSFHYFIWPSSWLCKYNDIGVMVARDMPASPRKSCHRNMRIGDQSTQILACSTKKQGYSSYCARWAHLRSSLILENRRSTIVELRSGLRSTPAQLPCQRVGFYDICTAYGAQCKV